jgi:membrane fusion protein, multidrug efflux system
MKRFRLSSSVLMATAVVAITTAWMLSGVGGESSGNEPVDPRRGNTVESATAASGSAAPQRAPMRVSVQHSEARTITREVTVSARTEANRSVELRAETEGRVVAIGAERGSAVAPGDAIATLDLRERNARLAEARAQVAHMELQYEAAQRLRGQQLAADVQIAEANAQLASARATLEQIELDITRTRVVAPFAAFVQARDVELGDFVSVGDPIARLVDTDPLIVVGEVSEREVMSLAIGARGRAVAVTGDTLDGRVRYLAPAADESTRTFRVELAVPNAAGALRAGMSADLRLDAGEIEAHALSASLLALDDSGAIGVKSVDADNVVHFHPVDVVSSSSDGIWVTGLPRRLRVIAVGQGFVNPGETVEPVAVDEAAPARAPR